MSPKTTKLKLQNEQVVPLNNDNTEQQQQDKMAKAFDFLKENRKDLESTREEGRMQAYGWSLPSKNTTPQSTLNITVPVPVYCRPLFKDENNLKLSCASFVTFKFDKPDLNPEYETLLEKSEFSNFKSNDTFKSSCIWICNFNENDTHLSIFDANRPGDLIQQFTLKSLKIHSLLSVTGVTKQDLNETEIRPEQTPPNDTLIQINKSEINDGLDNITYIECEAENDSGDMAKSVESLQIKRNGIYEIF